MGNLILGIETATKMCSVAISDGNTLLALKEEGGEYSHAEKLNGFIESCLQQAGINLQQLDVIAVSKGPGSYTGLRIGVSTAKGLCYSLNKPLISVDTLQALALKMQLESDKTDLYAPMIDARRMEVYTALYNVKNEKVKDVEAKIIDENSFVEELRSKKVAFFGDGAEKCMMILDQNKNSIFIKDILPSAQFVNQVALKKLNNKEFEDVAYFEPYYLKDFIATTAKKLL
ncbi:MAG: tRNA (adenosine(37)-N6)-threonylcarbamoyltransferase complex dimerization subunit type 1 TsaB [Vicingaceae bacterium]|nr:tRNA (adenosine(37)-N6)-threonylcarbamoyltransferase complex dimerization subunit type 1 TsaB [Vicingaceae bacterium]